MSIRAFFTLLVVALTLTTVLDVLLIVIDRQDSRIWGGEAISFWPAFALVWGAALAIGAKALARLFVRHPESYYDEDVDE